MTFIQPSLKLGIAHLNTVIVDCFIIYIRSIQNVFWFCPDSSRITFLLTQGVCVCISLLHWDLGHLRLIPETLQYNHAVPTCLTRSYLSQIHNTQLKCCRSVFLGPNLKVVLLSSCIWAESRSINRHWPSHQIKATSDKLQIVRRDLLFIHMHLSAIHLVP